MKVDVLTLVKAVDLRDTNGWEAKIMETNVILFTYPALCYWNQSENQWDIEKHDMKKTPFPEGTEAEQQMRAHEEMETSISRRDAGGVVHHLVRFISDDPDFALDNTVFSSGEVIQKSIRKMKTVVDLDGNASKKFSLNEANERTEIAINKVSKGTVIYWKVALAGQVQVKQNKKLTNDEMDEL